MTTTYSPQETAWQLIVSAVLDDDPRDHTRCGPDELDQLLAGVPDDVVLTLCAAAGMGAQLVRALAAAHGVPAETLVQWLGAGMSED